MFSLSSLHKLSGAELIAALVAVVALFAIIVYWLYRGWERIRDAGRAYKRYEENINFIAREERRTSNFPKIDTTMLIAVPEEIKDSCCSSNRIDARTFAVRNAFVLVIDEKGEAWFGLLLPAIKDCLFKAEYMQRPYIVPVRGQRQSQPGPIYYVNGEDIFVYPSWFSEPEPENAEDWSAWAKLWKLYEKETGVRASNYGAAGVYLFPDRNIPLGGLRLALKAAREYVGTR